MQAVRNENADDDEDTEMTAQAMRRFMEEAFPLCRSITGDGVRATLDLIGRELAGVAELERHEVPTGTPVLDWTVPNEWNLRRATLDGPDGRVLDSDDCNLHVLSYSTPVNLELTLDELRPHLFTLPDQPDAVPYRTSYYRETWGLCLSHNMAESLTDGTYRVTIDTTLAPGHLSYGEAVLPATDPASTPFGPGWGPNGDVGEILLTTHICHPSMANDNLSGIAAVTEAARRLSKRTEPRRHRIRLLFIPGTIGSITWLERNRDRVGAIRAGLVVAGAGDRAPATYKRSRRATTGIDLLMSRLISEREGSVIDYYPYGYDERQFCSPGFDLPVGRLSRSIHGTYPEYHSSADNLDFVDDTTLEDTVSLLVDAVTRFASEPRYHNLAPHGEPQLGRRGLYGAVGGAISSKSDEMAVLWMLSYSDGEHAVADIAAMSGMEIEALQSAADALVGADLLAPV
jgi:aminopeptidase-like protein